MTTHNTGNPVPSTAVKDLYDNAENLDSAVNSQSQTWNDRLGVPRKTWAGMEKSVLDALAGMGLTYAGVYGAGGEITSHNQWFEDSAGGAWMVRADVSLPFVFSGDFDADKVNFQPVTDFSLRSELASSAAGNGSDKIAQRRNLVPSAIKSLTNLVSSLNISPWEYADFAVQSSSDYREWDWSPAFNKIIEDLTNTRQMRSAALGGAVQLSGALINLGGFEFGVSAPVLLSSGVGNYGFSGGVISANDDFSGDYIFETQESTNTIDGLRFRDVYIDGRGVANCISIKCANIRCRLDGMNLLGFKDCGIEISNYGIEFVMTNSFIFRSFTGGAQSGVVGIRTEQTSDQHFDNIVIFGCDKGVHSIGSTANRYDKVHAYSCNDGIYLAGNSSATSIQNCYMDGCAIVAENPARMQIKDNYFVYGGSDTDFRMIVLKSITNNHEVRYLDISGNTFDSLNVVLTDAIYVDTATASISNANSRSNNVKDNMGRQANLRSTHIRKRTAYTKASSGSFDFSNDVLFGNMSSISFRPQNSEWTYSLSSVSVTAGGSGYTSPPVVRFSGDGTGASAIASIASGAVSSITIISWGKLFSTAPTVQIVGGGGSGATATAALATTGSFRSPTVNLSSVNQGARAVAWEADGVLWGTMDCILECGA